MIDKVVSISPINQLGADQSGDRVLLDNAPIESSTGTVKSGDSPSVSAGAPLGKGQKWAVAAAILLGIVLRVVNYAHNQPLWFDESALSLNILNRDFSQFLAALDYKQAAPPIWLWIEKACSIMFGQSEPSLRLLPLLSSIAALPLFVLVARRFLTPWQTLCAVILFACSQPQIQYGAEVKQYSSDVCTALAIYLCSMRYIDQPSRKNAVILSLVAVTAIWLSYPSIFILTGAIALLLVNARQATGNVARANAVQLAIMIISIVVGELAMIKLHMLNLASNRELMELYGVHSFLPATIIELPGWCFKVASEFCLKSIGISKLPLIVALSSLLAISGFVCAWRKNKLTAILITFAWLPVMVLNAMHVYPMVGRFLLFLAPPAIIFIFAGLSVFPSRLKAIAATLAVMILCAPFARGVSPLYTPKNREDGRSSLSYVHSHFQAGDYVYVFSGGRYTFRYYCALERWTPPDLFIGEAHRKQLPYDQELMRLVGKPRVWVVMLHTMVGDRKATPSGWVYSQLQALANRLDLVRFKDAEVLLCDFERKSGVPISESFLDPKGYQ